MSTSPSSASQSPADDRNLVPVDENYIAPTFEDRLRRFWAKNARLVLGAAALVLLAIVAKGIYGVIADQREKRAVAAYAAASRDAQLKAFSAEYAGHPLAGLALLRLADAAYAAGDFPAALTHYHKAGEFLVQTPFASRAGLGEAIASLQAGKSAEGEKLLKRLSGELEIGKGIRGEATYHLAVLAAEAGRAEDAVRFAEQAQAIDQTGQWGQRAAMLRTSLPAAKSTAAESRVKEDVSAISFKPSS